MHLKQKLNTVAFETCRYASYPDETSESAKSVGIAIATARGIHSPEVMVEATKSNNFPTRASLPLGRTLRARVSVAVDGNVPGPFVLFRGAQVKSQLVSIAAR